MLDNAGVVSGAGDWRAEKGSGNYGSFEVVNHDDPRLAEIMGMTTRDEQKAAMLNPEFYDDETQDLFMWFLEESSRRGLKVTLPSSEDVA